MPEWGWTIIVGASFLAILFLAAWYLQRREKRGVIGNRVAPKGYVYVCGRCGKRSRDRYGEQEIDHDWDESCMLNCVLYREDKLDLGKNGRVKHVRD